MSRRAAPPKRPARFAAYISESKQVPRLISTKSEEEPFY